MLANTSTMEHFHIYLAVSNLHLDTDHKPLVMIFKNSLAPLSPQLERLRLRISYQFTVQKGLNTPAEYLSRHLTEKLDCSHKFFFFSGGLCEFPIVDN